MLGKFVITIIYFVAQSMQYWGGFITGVCVFCKSVHCQSENLNLKMTIMVFNKHEPLLGGHVVQID